MHNEHSGKGAVSARVFAITTALLLFSCAPALYETTPPAKKEYGAERRVIELVNEARLKGGAELA